MGPCRYWMQEIASSAAAMSRCTGGTQPPRTLPCFRGGVSDASSRAVLSAAASAAALVRASCSTVTVCVTTATSTCACGGVRRGRVAWCDGSFGSLHAACSLPLH